MAKLPPSDNDDVRPRNKRRYDGERREAEGPQRGVPRKPGRQQSSDDWEIDDDDFDDDLEDDDLDMDLDLDPDEDVEDEVVVDIEEIVDDDGNDR